MNAVHALNRLRRNINEVFEENELMLHIIRGEAGMNAVHALNRLRRTGNEIFAENELPIHIIGEVAMNDNKNNAEPILGFDEIFEDGIIVDNKGMSIEEIDELVKQSLTKWCTR